MIPAHQQEVEYEGVLQEGEENEEHAGDHPGRDGRHPLDVGRNVGDGVEDVGQDQEQGHQQGHPSGHDLRRDQEAHPGHNHEQSGRQVVDVQISVFKDSNIV